MRSSSLRAYFQREMANRRPTSFDKATVLQLILSLRICSRFPSIPRDMGESDQVPPLITIFWISQEVRMDATQQEASIEQRGSSICSMRIIISAIDRQAEHETPSQLLKHRFPDPGASRQSPHRGVCAPRLLHSLSSASRIFCTFFRTTISDRRAILRVDPLRPLASFCSLGLRSMSEPRARSPGFLPGHRDPLPVDRWRRKASSRAIS
jgi:hypothetical protein